MNHEELRRLATEAISYAHGFAHPDNGKAEKTTFQAAASPDVVLALLDSIRRADELEAQQSETIVYQAGEIARLLADLDALRTLIVKLHAAKGRYHSQQSACDLFDAVGLKNERPVK